MRLDSVGKRFIAALASGVMLYFVVGLEPRWFIAWVAPIPLLLAAFQASAAETWLLCIVAVGAGFAGNFDYYTKTSGPLGAILIVLLQVFEWSMAVRFTRSVVLRTNHWLTIFAWPIAWAALDTLVSTFSPHGTIGSLAYTQMDASPLIQIASITGAAGIVFLFNLFPSAVAIALFRGAKIKMPSVAYGLPIALIVAALIYGATRLHNAKTVGQLPVGLVAIDEFIGRETGQESAAAIWDRYADATAELASQGARVVVLPEKIAVLMVEEAGTRERQLAQVARKNQIYLVAGVGISEANGKRNRAWMFDPTGRLVAEYDKQHPVPGLEAEFARGDRFVVRDVIGYRAGLAICKDMHFAALGRGYGRERVNVVLEPAWDFYVDGWMSVRLAALRGLESGYSVVHSARDSFLSVSDRFGRVTDEIRSRRLPGATLRADVPIGPATPTPYARVGDVFGWICVAAGLGLRFKLR